MKEFVTVDKMADSILETMKERNLLPEILDYGISAATREQKIFANEFCVKGDVNYGCEGIYLDMYLSWVFDSSREDKKSALITFKTLEDGDDALHIMCQLLADCMIVANEYIKEHYEDLNRSGYTLQEENASYCYTGTDKERLIEKAGPGKFVLKNLYTEESVLYEKNLSGEVRMLEKDS